jgi:hypothetical protein
LKRGEMRRRKENTKDLKSLIFKTSGKAAKKSLGKALMIEFQDAYAKCFANNLKRRE